MSSNKKSLSTLILLFLIIAGASWFYFSKDQYPEGMEGDDIAEVSQEEADTEAATTEDAQGHEGHSHAQNNNASPQKGTIHELSIKPILGRRGVGDPNAPVKIQEFFSLTCNHCATFHTGTYQTLKERFIDTGKVYFIYEEFPLNGPALYGSMVARCLPEERYAGFVDLLLRNQDKWAFGGDFKSSLQQNAKLAGMSDEEFEACFNNKELQQALGANIKEASDVWKISSTPSFVINNGEYLLSGGQSIEAFEKIINELGGSNDAAANKAEDAASAPFEPAQAQKEIWRDMEAGTYDPKTFEPSEGAVKELQERATDAVTDKVEENIPAVQ